MWTDNGEINEEYSCFVCDVQGMARYTIIFDSGGSRHMFAGWRLFKNLSTDVDLWVKCANGSLTKVLGVGDVGILRRDLLVPQLKNDLISEGQLAREMGWSVNAKDDWKRIINEEGLIEGNIVDDSNLYVVHPAYFVTNDEAPHLAMAKDSGQALAPFAGMADVIALKEEEFIEKRNMEFCYRMHANPGMQGLDPIQ